MTTNEDDEFVNDYDSCTQHANATIDDATEYSIHALSCKKYGRLSDDDDDDMMNDDDDGGAINTSSSTNKTNGSERLATPQPAPAEVVKNYPKK